VLETNPSSTAANAYPLTMLTYAAATPETLNQTSRQNYASFIDYAVGQGQKPGVEPGDLPAGYEPLPASLVSEAQAAANEILHPPVFPSTTTTPSTSNPLDDDFGSGFLGDSTAPSYGATNEFNPSSTSSKGSGNGHNKLGPAALSSVRISGNPVGLLRWVLPLLLLFGLLAGLLAFATKMAGTEAAAEGAAAGGTEGAESPEADPS
jgi:hypothetical protein